MSGSPTSSDQGNPTEKESSAQDASETVAEATECLNCGHEFTGNYCPECGQEADPSASVVEVIGGFFRELVDLEHGFWPTFVGLTVRPGAVLRDYLSGVRAGLISPGRYLLAAVVVDVGVDRLLAWIGAKDIPWADSAPASSANIGAETAYELGHVAGGAIRTIFVGPQTRIVGALLGAGLLTLLLYRLFEDELSRMAEALATGSFLVAHAIFLAGGASLLYVGSASLYAGHPVSSPMYLSVAIGVGYIGLASYQAFGPGWKPALKGMFAGIWTIVETVSVGMAGAGGLRRRADPNGSRQIRPIGPYPHGACRDISPQWPPLRASPSPPRRGGGVLSISVGTLPHGCIRRTRQHIPLTDANLQRPGRPRSTKRSRSGGAGQRSPGRRRG